MTFNSEVIRFIEENGESFENELLQEAATVREKINTILEVGNIDLINNAHKLVGYTMESKLEELQQFAKGEGIAWATHSLTLSFKLEWVQAIRRTVWTFVQRFIDENKMEIDFFQLERQINSSLDQFLNAFFISYSAYKDELLKAQRQLVENLSVPIIPITSTVCILPVIGSIDYFRSKVMEEKVLMEVGRLHTETLIMDLSGIAVMEAEVIDQLKKIIDGVALMGCTTAISGLRPDVVRSMVRFGVEFDKDTQMVGTLQQALSIYFKN
ncbi:STAS domain-containing protein [Sporosarcina sp. ACRSL]|uniref:STAS domain-containing protein n=1 Tax=Sporosarcina sp. ACRSL TaxID=2918215 RepID=UPI001EF3E8D6|nr:STAS domain-containing protein [Sporosarcina sp. ACRSL]MCG7345592.1 STAS domain-containing protein [Sporosarcina sp. ACRSL]